MTILPLAQVRNQLSALVDTVASTHETITITRNGVPAAMVMSTDDYESIMETLALVSDTVDRERLVAAERSMSDGDVTSSDEMAAIIRDRISREQMKAA